MCVSVCFSLAPHLVASLRAIQGVAILKGQVCIEFIPFLSVKKKTGPVRAGD